MVIFSVTARFAASFIVFRLRTAISTVFGTAMVIFSVTARFAAISRRFFGVTRRTILAFGNFLHFAVYLVSGDSFFADVIAVFLISGDSFFAGALVNPTFGTNVIIRHANLLGIITLIIIGNLFIFGTLAYFIVLIFMRIITSGPIVGARFFVSIAFIASIIAIIAFIASIIAIIAFIIAFIAFIATLFTRAIVATRTIILFALIAINKFLTRVTGARITVRIINTSCLDRIRYISGSRFVNRRLFFGVGIDNIVITSRLSRSRRAGFDWFLRIIHWDRAGSLGQISVGHNRSSSASHIYWLCRCTCRLDAPFVAIINQIILRYGCCIRRAWEAS